MGTQHYANTRSSCLNYIASVVHRHANNNSVCCCTVLSVLNYEGDDTTVSSVFSLSVDFSPVLTLPVG